MFDRAPGGRVAAGSAGTAFLSAQKAAGEAETTDFQAFLSPSSLRYRQVRECAGNWRTAARGSFSSRTRGREDGFFPWEGVNTPRVRSGFMWRGGSLALCWRGGNFAVNSVRVGVSLPRKRMSLARNSLRIGPEIPL